MKRIGTTLLGVIGTVLATVGPAFAQGSYPPDPPGGSSTTINGGGGELAFTGAEISVWMLIAAALIVAGTVALFVSRRRTAAQ